jgi:6-phosphogluconolactonase
VYVISELSGAVSAFSYKGTRFTSIQNISSHQENYSGAKGSADIHVSPDGKFVYATNRGDANTIAVFAIDQVTGMLNFKGTQSTMGVHPRNFTIDPSGKFLLVANRDSNNIVVFSIDPQTGMLTATGEPFEAPAPVFLGIVH